MNPSWATFLAAVVTGLTLLTSSAFAEVGYSYIFYPEPLNWTEAHKECKFYDSQLALPLTPEDAQTLVDFMVNNETTAIHVGFNDIFQEGNYLTNWGQSILEMGYQQWASDPAEDTDANCGSFIVAPTEGLKPISCSEELPFVCKYPLWRGTLGEGYQVAFGYGWFKLHNETADWPTAWETCRSEGAYLLVVRSKDEVDSLIKQYGNQLDGPIHYGAHHMFNNHKFITIFDEPLEDSYSIWYPGFPGTFTNVDSPVLNLAMADSWTSKGLLLNEASASLQYLCKQDAHYDN